MAIINIYRKIYNFIKTKSHEKNFYILACILLFSLPCSAQKKGENITGRNICEGATHHFPNFIPNGIWSSDNTDIATISSRGILKGIKEGVVKISYTGSKVKESVFVTVNPLPTITSDSLNLCTGATIQLKASEDGGKWLSATPSIATINADGVVTGISAGSSTITYSKNECYAKKTVHVKPNPSIIEENATICAGDKKTFSSASTGGTWAAGNANLSIDKEGIATAISKGTAIISYTLSSGCFATTKVTIKPLPVQLKDTALYVNSQIAFTMLGKGKWEITPTVTASVDQTTHEPVAIISGKEPGIATIKYTVGGCSTESTVTVTPRPKIAVGGCKFMGAIYSNFTGIKDDNPENFTATYLRLSRSLFEDDGIDDNADFGNRWMLLRNFMFEINYNNNDKNLKMYSFDTFGNKYANRLDLFAHAYFNGSLVVNLASFVMPQNTYLVHKRKANDTNKHKGESANFYLDFLMSLSLANIIDTGSKQAPRSPETNRVRTHLYGLSFKYKTTKGIYKSPFNIELGFQLFWLFPSSSGINPNLNAQYDRISDIYLDQNLSKSIITNRSGVLPYLSLNALVQYNTNPANSTSNIFIRYRYIDNYIHDFYNSHYHNNFFEFQLGYALDITKVMLEKK